MTTENKHTPGPWLVDDGSKSCHCCFEQTIYVITGPGEYDYDIIAETLTDNKSNARLIAAAPDLLEALEWCVNSLEYDYRGSADDYEIPQSVRAAIAKARGQ